VTTLKAILTELLGLFLDDGRLAGAILAWLVLGYLLLPRFGLPFGIGAFALFAGLVTILVESVLREASGRPG